MIETKGVISSDVIRRDYIENYSMQTCAEKYYLVYRQMLKVVH